MRDVLVRRKAWKVVLMEWERGSPTMWKDLLEAFVMEVLKHREDKAR